MIEQMNSLTADQKNRLVGGTALEFLGLSESGFSRRSPGGS